MKRAAVSVPSSIAEGQARYSAKEFRHFLSQSRGSLIEVETQLLIARDLGYLSNEISGRLLQKTSELDRILDSSAASIKAAA